MRNGISRSSLKGKSWWIGVKTKRTVAFEESRRRKTKKGTWRKYEKSWRKDQESKRRTTKTRRINKKTKRIRSEIQK